MGVRFKHFPEFAVTLNVFGGELTRDELMRFVDRLEPVAWKRWVNYLEPTADLSRLKPEDFSALKRALAVKLTKLHGDAHLASALVSASPAHDFFLHFWPSYVGYDLQYAVKTAAVPTLREACDRLGLPEAASGALEAAVSAS